MCTSLPHKLVAVYALLRRGEVTMATMVHDEEENLSIRLSLLLDKAENRAKLTEAEMHHRWRPALSSSAESELCQALCHRLYFLSEASDPEVWMKRQALSCFCGL